MDFIHFWRDDRTLSKIICSTILIPEHDIKVKVTDFEFLYQIFTMSDFLAKPLMNLNRVWYEWI